MLLSGYVECTGCCDWLLQCELHAYVNFLLNACIFCCDWWLCNGRIIVWYIPVNSCICLHTQAGSKSNIMFQSDASCWVHLQNLLSTYFLDFLGFLNEICTSEHILHFILTIHAISNKWDASYFVDVQISNNDFLVLCFICLR